MDKLAVKEKIMLLLDKHAANKGANESTGALISEKCFEMGHLYRDMEFASRIEMNSFMTLHYPSLAAKRPADVRWKKFLFDTIGEVAPACFECKDSGNCFKCDIMEQSA